MSDLDEIYNAAWVAHDFDAEVAEEFRSVATSLVRQFSPSHVFDVGCGPGLLLMGLRHYGVRVSGLEGSVHCVSAAPKGIEDAIVLGDIRKWNSVPYKVDLVSCTEVAEHVEAEHAAQLVKLLCSATCPIVFTAAPPGQDGNHHVNCQPKEYWLDLFGAHGVIEDIHGTFDMKRRWSSLKRLSHMERNVMVLR